ncbi:MAG: hypothetical protein J6Z34_06970 [Clostridia bacterium]|nr:hypothetical protein [Clostridia bacterium]
MSGFARLVVKVVTVIAAAVIGVVEVENLLPIDYNVELFVEAGEDYVFYYADLGEYTPENGEITVSVYNDFTKREKKYEGAYSFAEDLPDGERLDEDYIEENVKKHFYIDGYEENLRSGMKYTIEVLDGRKTIAKDTFRTVTKTAEENYPIKLTIEASDSGVFFSADLGDYANENDIFSVLVYKVRDEYGSGPYETECQVITEGDERFIQGEVWDLEPGTYYVINVFDGETCVAEEFFTTAEYTDYYSVELSVSATETGVSFSADLGDYVPAGETLTVTVYDTFDYGVVASTQARYDRNFVSGYIENLTPDTEYYMDLSDGAEVIAYAYFTTAEAFDICVTLSVAEDGSVVYVESDLYMVTPVAAQYYEPSSDYLTLVVLNGERKVWEDKVPVERDDSSNPYVTAEIYGLEPDINYDFKLKDGYTVIALESYTVPFTSLFYMEIKPKYDGVLYTAYLDDYEPENPYLVTVVCDYYGNDLYSAESYPSFSEDAGSIFEGTFGSLESETRYLIKVYDGETLVFKEEFTTPPYLSLSVSAMENAVSFFVDLGGYSYENDTFDVFVSDGYGESFVTECGAEETSDGNFIWGELSDLTPSTDYAIEIYDGNTLIASGSFRTLPHVDLSFSVEETGVTFSAYLGDYYPETQMTATIYEAADYSEVTTVDLTFSNYSVYGSASGLSPDTEYYMEVNDGDVILAADFFTTLEIYNISVELVVEGGQTAFFSSDMYAGNYQYTPSSTTLTLVVMLGGEKVQEMEVAIERDSSENISVQGEITDLEPGETYVIKLKDGHTVIAQTEFYVFFENLIDASITPGSTDVTIIGELMNYQPESSYFLAVIYDMNGEEVAQITTVPQASPTGVLFSGYIDSGLYPETEYTVKIYDNDTLIYLETFTTSEA